MAGFNDIKMAKINGGSFSYIVLEENKHVFHVDYSREYLAGSSGRTNTFKALPTKSNTMLFIKGYFEESKDYFRVEIENIYTTT